MKKNSKHLYIHHDRYLRSRAVYNVTYWEHMLTRSLSVVFWLRPRMYRFVLDSCSACWPCIALLLRFVLIVPLWLPVALLELLLVFAGDEAVGTRCPPYCKHHQYCAITEDVRKEPRTIDFIQSVSLLPDRLSVDAAYIYIYLKLILRKANSQVSLHEVSIPILISWHNR